MGGPVDVQDTPLAHVSPSLEEDKKKKTMMGLDQQLADTDF